MAATALSMYQPEGCSADSRIASSESIASNSAIDEVAAR